MPEVTLAPPTVNHPESQVIPEMLIPEQGWQLALDEIGEQNLAIRNIKTSISNLQGWNELIDLIFKNVPIKICSNYSADISRSKISQESIFSELQLLNQFPDLQLLVASDYYEAHKMMHTINSSAFPTLIRVANSKLPVVTSGFAKFELGKADILREGSDASIITYGSSVYYALAAARVLDSLGIRCRVVNLHTLNPLDQETIKLCLNETEGLLIVEDPFNLSGVANTISRIAALYKPSVIEIIDQNPSFYIAMHRPEEERTAMIVEGVKRVMERG